MECFINPGRITAIKLLIIEDSLYFISRTFTRLPTLKNTSTYLHDSFVYIDTFQQDIKTLA